jgi:hypothetical protein
MNREPLSRNRRTFLREMGSGIAAMRLAGAGAAGAVPSQRPGASDVPVGPSGKKKNLQYAVRGGAEGKLFLAKPHKVFRYAKILQKRGDI